MKKVDRTKLITMFLLAGLLLSAVMLALLFLPRSVYAQEAPAEGQAAAGYFSAGRRMSFTFRRSISIIPSSLIRLSSRTIALRSTQI